MLHTQSWKFILTGELVRLFLHSRLLRRSRRVESPHGSPRVPRRLGKLWQNYEDRLLGTRKCHPPPILLRPQLLTLKSAQQDKATYRAIMKDNFGPAMNWYRAAIRGINLEDEKSALASGEMDGKLHMPVFMLCASRDPLANVKKIEENMSKVAEDLKVETLPTGHWAHLEEAEKVNAFLEEFVVVAERRSEEGKL